MNALERLDALLNGTLMIIGGVALFALMILATGNVILRIVQVPFSGAYEIVSFLGAVVIASALGYTQRKKDHIVVDILTDKYAPGAKRAVNALSHLATCIFFAVVTWQVFLWGNTIRESGELSETLKIVYHPFVYAVALGFAAVTVASFLDILQTLFKPREVDS